MRLGEGLCRGLVRFGTLYQGYRTGFARWLGRTDVLRVGDPMTWVRPREILPPWKEMADSETLQLRHHRHRQSREFANNNVGLERVAAYAKLLVHHASLFLPQNLQPSHNILQSRSNFGGSHDEMGSFPDFVLVFAAGTFKHLFPPVSSIAATS
jgi:hypothetical protein